MNSNYRDTIPRALFQGQISREHQGTALLPDIPDSTDLLSRLRSGGRASSQPSHLIFIDQTVSNYEQLVAGASSNTAVVLLDSSQDAIQQITAVLAQSQQVEGVHIVSHGRSGGLRLGDAWLDYRGLDRYSSQLKSWRSALTADADILLYGCEVAADAGGIHFVQQLSQLTGADVAASSDLTGSKALGGDWQLEVTTGAIESSLAFAADTLNSYDFVLDANYTSFAGATGLRLNGSAAIATNALRLTPALNNQAGSAFLTNAYTVTGDTSFQSRFQFRIGGGTGGADGFTFLLHNNAAGASLLGSPGSGLGFANSGTRSLAIEFDTHNLSDTELNNNHIGINLNGSSTSVVAAAAPLDLNSGSSLNAWVDYNGSTNLLEVFLSNTATKPGTAVLSRTLDLTAILGTQAFVGFTGSTGGLTNTHDIENWSFTIGGSTITPPPPPPPPAGDTTAPTASLSAGDIGTSGGTTQTFTVTYSDSSGIQVSTLDGTDIQVLGPNGFNSPATLVSVDTNSNGTPRTATYRITAPGGTWDAADNGSYSVVLQANQVSDTVGNFMSLTSLGSFSVGIGSTPPPTGGASVNYANFTGATGLRLNGSAALASNVLRLTPAQGNQAGTAFLNNAYAVNADTSFQSRFQFRIGGGTGGADGFTFLLQNNTAGAGFLGAIGGALGYAAAGAGGLAIEFDTYNNGGIDPNDNHIGINLNGSLTSVATAAAPFDLNSGSSLNAWVDYNGGTNLLEVFLSNTANKPGTAVLSRTLDLAGLLGSQAFVGFSAGTGGLTNTHEIENWSFSTDSSAVTPPPPPPPAPSPGTLSIEENRLTVNEGAGSVTVAVVRTGGSDGVATIDYTTVDGTAVAGSDYTRVSGTLRFEAGETRKTVTIPILNDTLAEDNETFSFSADRVTGAGLGVSRTALITIADDDSTAPPPPGGTTANYTTFAGATGLRLNGSAAIASNVLRLTPAQGNQAGTAFLNNAYAVNADTSFQSRFQFRIGGGTGGADGFTFLLQNNAAGAGFLGSGGGALGYAATGAGGLAIEFDTYNNGGIDPNDNHIGINLNGSLSSVVTATAPFDLNAGTPLNAWVEYNGSNNLLQVFLSNTTAKPTTALLSRTVDLPAVVGGTTFVGFSAGTGGLFNTHDIENWEFSTNAVIAPAPAPPPPTGSFIQETVISGLIAPTAFDWSPDNSRMYIAQQNGVVRLFENGTLLPTPFIDISDQVNGVRDRGLLGIAVHPNFATNPYVYLLYTYDPPEVYQPGNISGPGLSGPDEAGNRPSRLVRVTADASTGYRTAIPGSAVILLGENSIWAYTSRPDSDGTDNLSHPPSGINNGTTINAPASLLEPGTNNIRDYLATDSQSHSIGSVRFGPDGMLYVSNGDGTSYGRVDPRSSRVQDLDNLSGKLLRIDPLTGDGLPDNPFYNGVADSNRSKVFNYGLRNPFRFTFQPGTGLPVIGDVGWTNWEEINVGRGQNFGWPYYEGGYVNNTGVSLQQAGYAGLPEAPEFYRSAQVTAPFYALNHADGATAIIMGDYYQGTSFPEVYRGALFFGDVNNGPIRAMFFNPDNSIASVQVFDDTDVRYIVSMRSGSDSNMYYANIFNGTIGRWRYSA